MASSAARALPSAKTMRPSAARSSVPSPVSTLAPNRSAMARRPGTPGLRAIAERFGASVLTGDGTLDRAALGRIVFAEGKARAALEAIVHPEIYRRIREWFANLPSPTGIAIADIPLVF